MHMSKKMKVLITGARGFLGTNLHLHLAERKHIDVVYFTRDQHLDELPFLLQNVEFIFHLAGVNRANDPDEFWSGNVELTRCLCDAVGAIKKLTGLTVPIVYSSSVHASQNNLYGRTKREAENLLQSLANNSAIPVHIFRLPNVFGKWSRPNYNSAVATFCHNIARNLPININDRFAPVTLVYVDDVIGRFIELLDGANAALDADGFSAVTPQYTTTVGELVQKIENFKSSRSTLMSDRVGNGFLRALYSTYVSYLPPDAFSYLVPQHADSRGVFVEMLKTPDAGQISFFTARPGVTRGGHYHHSKTEKFLLVKGRARFRFRHMLTGETYELITSGEKSEIVETVPGWTHDITNIGMEEMFVILWANEVFDHENPDTFVCPL